NTHEVFMVTTEEIEKSEDEWHISSEYNSIKDNEETWFEEQLLQQFSN
ncbi:8564_t:CDS:1, partial [Funneliformis caledonium]